MKFHNEMDIKFHFLHITLFTDITDSLLKMLTRYQITCKRAQ